MALALFVRLAARNPYVTAIRLEAGEAAARPRPNSSGQRFDGAPDSATCKVPRIDAALGDKPHLWPSTRCNTITRYVESLFKFRLLAFTNPPFWSPMGREPHQMAKAAGEEARCSAV